MSRVEPPNSTPEAPESVRKECLLTSPGPPMTIEQQLREMNAALLVSSARQHELTELAQ